MDWDAFLNQWNRDIIADDRLAGLVPADFLAMGWLGFPGATADQLGALERRLGRALPSSYRAFLLCSNGWRIVNPLDGSVRKLWGVEEVEPFADRNQDWIAAQLLGDSDVRPADDEYFVYGDAQLSYIMRPEYLRTAIAISDQAESSIYLMFPEVTGEDGEWEALLLDDGLPGAVRYPSFEALMRGEYEFFLRLRDETEADPET